MSRVDPTRAATSATARRSGSNHDKGFERIGVGHLGVVERGRQLQ